MSFLGLISAVGSNRVIGANNDLLWHLPDDFKFFKRITKERVVIMGRKTYDSMGEALINRYNFVLSRQKDFKLDDARCFSDYEECLVHASLIDETPFVIGGQHIYEQYLNKATHLFITKVDFEKEGDAYFPEFDTNEFKLIASKFHEADEKHAHSFTFQIWEREGAFITEGVQSFLKQQIESL